MILVKVEPDINSYLLKEDGFNEDLNVEEKENPSIRTDEPLVNLAETEKPLQDGLVSECYYNSYHMKNCLKST